MAKGENMFIQIKAKDLSGEDKEMAVNTSQIAFLVEGYVHMSNGASFQLDEKEMKKIEADLYGDFTTAKPGASQHVEQLINDINRLSGGTRDAKPTTDRKPTLKTRLKDFTEDELKKAAENLGNDEFMQGANESGKRYGTIDYLLRTSANVNKWLEDQPDKKKSMF